MRSAEAVCVGTHGDGWKGAGRGSLRPPRAMIGTRSMASWAPREKLDSSSRPASVRANVDRARSSARFASERVGNPNPIQQAIIGDVDAIVGIAAGQIANCRTSDRPSNRISPFTSRPTATQSNRFIRRHVAERRSMLEGDQLQHRIFTQRGETVWHVRTHFSAPPRGMGSRLAKVCFAPPVQHR